jgi:hypothetical protein
VLYGDVTLSFGCYILSKRVLLTPKVGLYSCPFRVFGVSGSLLWCFYVRWDVTSDMLGCYTLLWMFIGVLHRHFTAQTLKNSTAFRVY